MTPSAKLLRSLRMLSVVMLAAAAIGCSSIPKTPPAALAAFKPELALQRAWSIQTSAPLSAGISIDAKHTLVLLAHSGEVVAHHAATGALLWRAQNIGLVEAPLALAQDGQSVLALVQGKEAISLDAKTGKVLWRAVLPAEMYVQAVSVNGLFIVLTADGRIVGIDEDSGRRRWAIARNIPDLSVRGSGAMTVMDGNVLVGLPGGKAVSIKVSNGQMNWEAGLAEVRGVNEVERIADALPDWVLMKELGACVSVYRHRITCLDAQGKVSFSQEINAVSSSAVTQSPAMLASVDEVGDVKAWASSTTLGNPAAWVFEGLRGRKSTSLRDIATQGDTVFVSDSLGFVHGLHAKTGKTIVRAAVAQGNDLTVAVWAGDIQQRATLITAVGTTIQSWAIASTSP